MVSAFAARQKLVLGQVKVSEKSNEIIAIPQLLAMLAIEGAIVTIVVRLRTRACDAMGCQRDIAQAIIDQKADYVLALKGNQGTLREDVEVFVAEQMDKGFPDTATSRAETIDADHGRIETRTTTVIHDVGWLQERHGWPALRGIVIVESHRELPAPTRKIEREMRFYITSLALPAQQLGPIIRSHWAIENSLHWVTADRDVLDTTVAVMHETCAMDGSPACSACSRASRTKPALPVGRARRPLSGTIVLVSFPRIAPRKPICRIRRATVQRATDVPSRLSCRQTFRTP